MLTYFFSKVGNTRTLPKKYYVRLLFNEFLSDKIDAIAWNLSLRGFRRTQSRSTFSTPSYGTFFTRNCRPFLKKIFPYAVYFALGWAPQWAGRLGPDRKLFCQPYWSSLSKARRSSSPLSSPGSTRTRLPSNLHLYTPCTYALGKWLLFTRQNRELLSKNKDKDLRVQASFFELDYG